MGLFGVYDRGQHLAFLRGLVERLSVVRSVVCNNQFDESQPPSGDSLGI